MAYEHDALVLINTMQDDLTALVGTIIDTMSDHRVSAAEGLEIARQATAMATKMVMALKAAPAEMRAAVLDAFEQGHWTVEG